MKYKREGNQGEIDDTRDSSSEGKERREVFGTRLSFELRKEEELEKRRKKREETAPAPDKKKKKSLLAWD